MEPTKEQPWTGQQVIESIRWSDPTRTYTVIGFTDPDETKDGQGIPFILTGSGWLIIGFLGKGFAVERLMAW